MTTTADQSTSPTWSLILNPDQDDVRQLRFDADSALVGSADQSDVNIDGPALLPIFLGKGFHPVVALLLLVLNLHHLGLLRKQ